jgi:hypothetical protein
MFKDKRVRKAKYIRLECNGGRINGENAERRVYDETIGYYGPH